MLRNLSLTTTAVAAAASLQAIEAPQARAQNAAALTGQVTSAEEGAMEGVIVSARKDGSNMTVSVVSDDQGRFSFPANRLAAGHYAVSIRAAGYDLAGPGSADVTAGTAASIDVKLRKTGNLSSELTNAEWLMSMPGTENDKMQLLNCVSCHTLERIVKSTHNADEFVQVVARMQGYAQVSQPIKPQPRVDQSRAGNPERFRKFAEFLASINLSDVPRWEYALKTMPRVKGRGTHVVITEYERRDRRSSRMTSCSRTATPGTPISARNISAASTRKPASTRNSRCRTSRKASRPARSISSSTRTEACGSA